MVAFGFKLRKDQSSQLGLKWHRVGNGVNVIPVIYISDVWMAAPPASLHFPAALIFFRSQLGHRKQYFALIFAVAA